MATLYKADGKTKIEKNTDSLYHIMNYTQEEIIKASMDYSKTATVNDWDKRTYDINITAASTSTSTITTTEKAVADIMLVLDVSGSMDKTTVSYSYVAENTTDGRAGLNTGTLYYVKKMNPMWNCNIIITTTGERVGILVMIGGRKLKQMIQLIMDAKYIWKNRKETYSITKCGKTVITDTANKSPDSKIGITAFSSAGYGSHGKTEDLQKAGDNKENLTRFVDSLVANGGTDPYVGLKNAKVNWMQLQWAGIQNLSMYYCLLMVNQQDLVIVGTLLRSRMQKNITNGTESIKV